MSSDTHVKTHTRVNVRTHTHTRARTHTHTHTLEGVRAMQTWIQVLLARLITNAVVGVCVCV